jgi:hypothetical protein
MYPRIHSALSALNFTQIRGQHEYTTCQASYPGIAYFLSKEIL